MLSVNHSDPAILKDRIIHFMIFFQFLRHRRHWIFKTTGGIEHNHPLIRANSTGFPLHFQCDETSRALGTQVQTFFGTNSGPSLINSIIVYQGAEPVGFVEYLQHQTTTYRIWYTHTVNLGSHIFPGFNHALTGFESLYNGTSTS